MALEFVFLIILAGFVSGQILRYLLPKNIDIIRDIAAFLSIRLAIPFSVMASLWALNIQSNSLAVLPIIGTCILLSGFVLGLLICRIQGFHSIQRGVVAPAVAYTNIGGIGSFVVFSFLGEQGFALVPLYKLFEELIYFGLLFPFAAKHSQAAEIVNRKWWQDRTIQIMLAALVLGFSLNLSALPRPEFFASLLDFTIPLGAFFMMMATGIIFRFNNILPNLAKALPVVVLKPILLCLIAIGFIYLFDIPNQPNANILAGICMILALMPTAFLASIPASMYKLDVDLANTIWIFSTCTLFVILPLIVYLLDSVTLFK